MSDPNCVFCKIVAGQIPSYRVFEDEAALAFLDVGPLAEGHLLVVPKDHYETIDQMPPELAGRVAAHLPRLSRAVMQVTSAEGFNILQNNGAVSGQQVSHVHFHIIPRVESDGLGYRWLKSSYAPGRAEHIHQRLTETLQQ